MNKDITEWLLDEGIEPLCEIVNNKNETIFLSDLLEKHLTEQLTIQRVVEAKRTLCGRCNGIGQVMNDNGTKMVNCRYCT